MPTYDYNFYLGPHSPLSIQLQRQLVCNSDRLREIDAECPAAKMHREVLSEFLKLPANQLMDGNTRQIYLDTVLDYDHTRRVIYNFDAFFGSRQSSLEHAAVYPGLERKVFPLRHLTYGHTVTIFLCLQSFADFVDNELAGQRDLHQRLCSDQCNLNFSWVPFVSRLQKAWPEANIVIISSQDLAPKWAAIVSLISGHPLAHTFEKISDFPCTCMNRKGRIAYRKYLAETPPKNLGKWLEVTSFFCNIYGFRNLVSDRVEGNTWTPDQFRYSQEVLEQDMAKLRELKNVTLASQLMVEL